VFLNLFTYVAQINFGKSYMAYHVFQTIIEIDRYGFFEADTDSYKIFKLVFCFIIKNMVYFIPYLFFKNFKNQDLLANIFEIAAISKFD